jgi:hypothetical protein
MTSTKMESTAEMRPRAGSEHLDENETSGSDRALIPLLRRSGPIMGDLEDQVDRVESMATVVKGQ